MLVVAGHPGERELAYQPFGPDDELLTCVFGIRAVAGHRCASLLTYATVRVGVLAFIQQMGEGLVDANPVSWQNTGPFGNEKLAEHRGHQRIARQRVEASVG